MKRKTLPKFIEICGNIINVSAIKTIEKMSYGYSSVIEIEYSNGFETKYLKIYFKTFQERDETFNKIMEELL